MGASEVVNSSGSFSLEGKAVEPGGALVVATGRTTGQTECRLDSRIVGGESGYKRFPRS